MYCLALVLGLVFAIVVILSTQDSYDRDNGSYCYSTVLLQDNGCTYDTNALTISSCMGPCTQQTMVIGYNAVPVGSCPPNIQTVSCNVSEDCQCQFDSIKNYISDVVTLDNMLPCGPVCYNATTGDTCNVSCSSISSSGIALVQKGSNKFTCLSNGTWGYDPSNIFTCEYLQATCSSIINSRAQSVNGDCVGASPGSTCSVQCHLDFNTSYNDAFCGANGQWAALDGTPLDFFGCLPNGCCENNESCPG